MRRLSDLAGMTAMEVVVAISLGLILTAVLTVVWVQSTRIYVETSEKLQVYESARRVLDIMDRDLSGCARTVTMEPESAAATAPRERSFRAPWQPQDPLVLQKEPEFANDTGAGDDLNDPSVVPRILAPLIFSPRPYKRATGDTTEAHWRDEIYLRTSVAVSGEQRPALVHYRLANVGTGHPSLRRRVWHLGPGGTLERGSQASDVTTLLADGVTDLKIAFLWKSSPDAGAGRWFHVRPEGPVADDTSDPDIQELVEEDTMRFAPARSAALAGGMLADQFHGANALTFAYEGWGKLELPEHAGVRFRAIKYSATERPPQVLPWSRDLFGEEGKSDARFEFPGVRAGDPVFLSQAQDDDPDHAADEESARNAAFPDRVFTVSDVVTARSSTSLELAERIDFARLGSWLGKEGNGEIRASFDARYRVGVLPSAILVRLCYDDKRHGRVIPIERVIRLANQ